MLNKKLNVYIATLSRSGSTLLGMMLDNHSKVFHMGESFYWKKLNPNSVKCSCGEVGCEILTHVYNRVNNLSEVNAIYDACSMIDQIEEPKKIYHKLSLPNNKRPLGSVNLDYLACKLKLSCIGIETLSNIFRETTGMDIIVDNTKSIRTAEYLVKRKNWKIILLTRDPMGMASSNKNAGARKKVPRTVAMKIPVYIEFAKRALRIIGMQNVLHIKYEDLCLNPKVKLGEICNFINVSFEEKMLAFKFNRGHTLMGNRMRFNSNDKIKEDLSWMFNLSDKEKKEVYQNKEIVSLFGELGYKLT